MLSDAVAAYLEAVSERAFDEPLMALLRARGFASVRLVHGAREFGKDVIAQCDGEQWGFQSKAGNIGQSEWRALTGQLDELRVVNLGHGAFNTDLPRRPVLVTTGRLVGNAPELYGDYNKRAKEKGEPELGLWDRDILLGQLAGDPESVLSGSIDGQLMSLLGAAEARTVTMHELEVFSRRWMTWDPERLAGLGVIEAALVCEKLRGVDRLDLACHLALCLMRAVWASGALSLPDDTSAPAARSLFEAYARALWDKCGDELLEHPLLNDIEFGGWVTYPVRCVRLAEILGLLALLVKESDTELSGKISRWLVTLCEKQPGVAHPISDQYAVSVIPAVLALATVDREAAEAHLKRCTVWLCDRCRRAALQRQGRGEPSRERARMGPARHRIGAARSVLRPRAGVARGRVDRALGLRQPADTGPMPPSDVSRGRPAPGTIASLRMRARRRRPPRLPSWTTNRHLSVCATANQRCPPPLAPPQRTMPPQQMNARDRRPG